jgi:hypothetical protein
MSTTTFICISALIVALVSALERARFQKYWSRACTGRLWRRRFPDASKAEIREFLDLFITAFGFSESRRLCFAPDDRVMDVYRTRYPHPKMSADSMELESFITRAEERYGVDLLPSWKEEVTLGDLFIQVRRPAA